MSSDRAAPSSAPSRLDIGLLNNRPGAGRIMSALGAADGSARFVGGCVRDAVLGRPIRDIDVATIFRPEDVIRRLEDAGLKAVPTGVEHGTVTGLAEGNGFEITTLRKDVETDGRHAVVAFTDDWVEDAARRDFTMNALSADISGRVYDPFGGIADALAGRVRFVGDAETRIREDVLRILRLFRFHAHYGTGALDADDLEAAGRLAAKLPALSAERVRSELMRLMEADDPRATVDAMASAGVLDHLPLDADRRPSLALLIAVDPEKDPLRRIFVLANRNAAVLSEALRFSTVETRRMAAMETPLAVDAGEVALKAAIYRGGADAVRDRLLVTAALTEQAGPSLDDALDLSRTWKAPSFPLKGRDLLTLGASEGPGLGDALRDVETWWMDGGYRANHAQCLAEARRRLNLSE